MRNLLDLANLLAATQWPARPAIPQKSVTQSAPLVLDRFRLDYAFFQRHVFHLIPSHLPPALREPQTLAALGAGVVAAISVSFYFLTRKRPTAEEIERERRDMIAHTGRITDGTIMDTMISQAASTASIEADSADGAMSDAPAPNIIVYNYRIAGVTYECAQDVSTLAEQVRGIRSDLPIQVRYAPHNPGNSIVVADSWSGLRLTSTHPYTAETHTDSAA